MPAKYWSVDSQTLKLCLNLVASSLNLIIWPDLSNQLKVAFEDNDLINVVCQQLVAILTALLVQQNQGKILFGLCSTPDTLIASWSAALPQHYSADGDTTVGGMTLSSRQAGRSHWHTGPLAWQPTVWPSVHHHLAINQAEARRKGHVLTAT